MKREFLQNLKVGDQPLSKEVIDAIMEENGRDIEGAKVWQEKYNQAVAQHETQLRQLRFDSVLEQAILLAKGRNAKAITALLDVEALTGYDFWICETGGTMTFPYEFAVWQYSHEGTVDGINGDTSLSISLKEW